MANCTFNGCKKKEYCEYGAYCKKVNPRIRQELLKTSKVSAIDVEIFKARGCGESCNEN